MEQIKARLGKREGGDRGGSWKVFVQGKPLAKEERVSNPEVCWCSKGKLVGGTFFSCAPAKAVICPKGIFL